MREPTDKLFLSTGIRGGYSALFKFLNISFSWLVERKNTQNNI